MKDARAYGTILLALAVRAGASAGVKDLLFEAHPEAAAEAALHEVVQWGPKAVAAVITACPEVQCSDHCDLQLSLFLLSLF